MFAGLINPGQLVIEREIMSTATGGFDFDTAVFSDVLANYSSTPERRDHGDVTMTHRHHCRR